MRKERIFCDNCEKEIATEKNHRRTVSIRIDGAPAAPGEKELCEKCLKKLLKIFSPADYGEVKIIEEVVSDYGKVKTTQEQVVSEWKHGEPIPDIPTNLDK